MTDPSTLSPAEIAIQQLEASLIKKYPCGVPRRDIGSATGGILHSRTCANEDSLGNGVPGRFRVGRLTVYPVPGVIQKIKSKLVAV